MTVFLKRLWHAAPIATVILAFALTAGVFFGVRMTTFWVYWHDPEHREQVIVGWMTPNYISHSWRVPRDVILDALDIPDPRPAGPMNLTTLAAQRGVPVEDLIAATEDAIATFRAEIPLQGQDQVQQ